MIKNYYEILNVKHSATSDEIKTSFRKVAFFWHPDRNSNPIAIEKMKSVEKLYVLENSFKSLFEKNGIKFVEKK